MKLLDTFLKSSISCPINCIINNKEQKGEQYIDSLIVNQ